jgi:hypothetical protein
MGGIEYNQAAKLFTSAGLHASWSVDWLKGLCGDVYDKITLVGHDGTIRLTSDDKVEGSADESATEPSLSIRAFPIFSEFGYTPELLELVRAEGISDTIYAMSSVFAPQDANAGLDAFAAKVSLAELAIRDDLLPTIRDYLTDLVSTFGLE